MLYLGLSGTLDGGYRSPPISRVWNECQIYDMCENDKISDVIEGRSRGSPLQRDRRRGRRESCVAMAKILYCSNGVVQSADDYTLTLIYSQDMINLFAFFVSSSFFSFSPRRHAMRCVIIHADVVQKEKKVTKKKKNYENQSARLFLFSFSFFVLRFGTDNGEHR